MATLNKNWGDGTTQQLNVTYTGTSGVSSSVSRSVVNEGLDREIVVDYTTTQSPSGAKVTQKLNVKQSGKRYKLRTASGQDLVYDGSKTLNVLKEGMTD